MGGASAVEGAGAPAPFFMGSLPETLPWPTGDGVRGPLLDLIGYDRQYNEVASYLLGDVLVGEMGGGHRWSLVTAT